MENRESFFKRLEPFFAPSVLLDINLAYTLAKFSHRSQTRKESNEDGTPVRYFEHVRRVALVMIDEAKIVSKETIVSCLLHDGIEDTRDLTPEMIERFFGQDVVTIVKTLSKVPKEGYLDRLAMSSDWRPYAIKACDRLDNLRSLGQATREFQSKQVKETQEKYYPIFDRMLTLSPRDQISRLTHVRDEIFKTTERHAARIEVA
jgi:GTP pyrophosphokinase